MNIIFKDQKIQETLKELGKEFDKNLEVVKRNYFDTQNGIVFPEHFSSGDSGIAGEIDVLNYRNNGIDLIINIIQDEEGFNISECERSISLILSDEAFDKKVKMISKFYNMDDNLLYNFDDIKAFPEINYFIKYSGDKVKIDKINALVNKTKELIKYSSIQHGKFNFKLDIELLNKMYDYIVEQKLDEIFNII